MLDRKGQNSQMPQYTILEVRNLVKMPFMFAKFTPKHKKHTIAITKLAEVVLKLVTNASQIAGKCQ